MTKPPRVFANRYRLDKLIGAGGMGEVWRATDLSLNREVAVKLLLPRLVAAADGVARFEREARVGATLTHANAIHTLDFGRDGDTCFLVIEYLAGGSLYELLQARGPLSHRETLAVAEQIADALSAAHRIGLVHRDLKPENVLVERTPDLKIKVADFGMAFLLHASDPRDGRITEGASAGTPEYMAPEQMGGGEIGPSVDIYALGCLIFELATGEPPYAGAVAKVVAAHLYAPIPALDARRADVPPGLSDLVGRMLSKRPDDRPTVEAVRRRLALIAGGNGAVVSDRSSRMLPTSPPMIMEERADAGMVVTVLGALGQDHYTALAAAGYAVAESDRASAIVVLGASLETVAEVVARGIPVLADAAASDFARISELLKIGASDVVLTPIMPAQLVRKVARVVASKRKA